MAEAASASLAGPMILAGVSMLVGTSAGITLRYGSHVKREAWKGLLGRRKYEIIFRNLSGTNEDDMRAQVRRTLRWIGLRPEVRSTCKELMRYGLKEEDGSITKLRLPIEPIVLNLPCGRVWTALLRDRAGLIEGFEFWTYRWGFFSSGEPQTHFTEMMAYVDTVIDGEVSNPKDVQERLLTKCMSTNFTSIEFDYLLRESFKGKGDITNDLGVLYQDGLSGLPKDLSKAESLYRKAWTQGEVAGAYNLASIYFARKDYDLSEAHFEMVAKRNVGEGYLGVAHCRFLRDTRHGGLVKKPDQLNALLTRSVELKPDLKSHFLHAVFQDYCKRHSVVLSKPGQTSVSPPRPPSRPSPPSRSPSQSNPPRAPNQESGHIVAKAFFGV